MSSEDAMDIDSGGTDKNPITHGQNEGTSSDKDKVLEGNERVNRESCEARTVEMKGSRVQQFIHT
jgi:hypothetical protein